MKIGQFINIMKYISLCFLFVIAESKLKILDKHRNSPNNFLNKSKGNLNIMSSTVAGKTFVKLLDESIFRFFVVPTGYHKSLLTRINIIIQWKTGLT